LPTRLQSLEFGDGFNQPLEAGVLPSSLQSLTFGYCFNQPLEAGVLPSSLQLLAFNYGSRIDHQMRTRSCIPASCRVIFT